MAVAWTILHILLNFHDACFNIFNIHDHLSTRDFFKKPYYKYISALAVGIIYNLINFSTNFSLISAYLFPMVVVVYLILFFKGDWFYKVFWMVLLYTIIVTTDYLGAVIVVMIHNVSIKECYVDGIYRFQTILLCRSFSTIIWIYLHQKRTEILEKANSTLKVLTILCFSIAFIATTAILHGTSNLNATGESIVLTFLALTAILFFLIAVIKERQARKSLKNIEYTLSTKQKELSKRYQYEIINAYKEVRKFRTDILELIQFSWPTNGQQSRTRYIEEYLESVDSLNRAFSMDIQTGDSLIDTVLFIKESDAFRKGISLEVHGELHNIVAINIEDICVILDCILSEAIENVYDIKDDGVIRTINLLFTKGRDGLYIKVDYPIGDNMNEDSKTILESMVSQYCGRLEYTVRDMYCDISIYLAYPNFISHISAEKGESRIET